jgi:circadian clock protein KaiB
MARPANSVGAFEAALDASQRRPLVLRLYIAGGTATSMRAVENLRAICKDHVGGKYRLEVIDIYRHPELLRRDQIVAVPTLVKAHPLPVRRIVGDLSDLARVLAGLNIQPKAHRDAAKARKANR